MIRIMYLIRVSSCFSYKYKDLVNLYVDRLGMSQSTGLSRSQGVCKHNTYPLPFFLFGTYPYSIITINYSVNVSLEGAPNRGKKRKKEGK